MADLDPTYVFEGETVYAMHEGNVIAKGKSDEIDRVESDALAYLDGLKKEKTEKKRATATHIVTPNGLKGKILNRVSGIWGEEISVKFENGEHSRFTVTAGTVADWVTDNQRTASVNKVAGLQERLDSGYDTDVPSLAKRHAALKVIAQEASDLIRVGVSDGDAMELDRIRLIADGESYQVADEIDRIQAENIEPYAPPKPQVVPQADLGRGAGDSWIDNVYNDIVAEEDGQDFDKILTDDPVLLATELETPVLADQGVAREMALAHVMSRTAGYIGGEVETYRDKFLARFEQARRIELSTRQNQTRKEAAVAESTVVDAPDEAFFM